MKLNESETLIPYERLLCNRQSNTDSLQGIDSFKFSRAHGSSILSNNAYHGSRRAKEILQEPDGVGGIPQP